MKVLLFALLLAAPLAPPLSLPAHPDPNEHLVVAITVIDGETIMASRYTKHGDWLRGERIRMTGVRAHTSHAVEKLNEMILEYGVRIQGARGLYVKLELDDDGRPKRSFGAYLACVEGVSRTSGKRVDLAEKMVSAGWAEKIGGDDAQEER